MPTDAIPTPARQCGGCTLCCKILSIEELAKPQGSWCTHCAPGQGCTIHATRPEECRAFFCGWLLDTTLPEAWRPDRSKIVFQPGDRNIFALVDPGSPDAWRREPYNSWLRRKAAEGLDKGFFVAVSTNGAVTLVLPEQEQFLGTLGTGDQIDITKSTSPGGPFLEVKVTRHTPKTQET